MLFCNMTCFLESSVHTHFLYLGVDGCVGAQTVGVWVIT